MPTGSRSGRGRWSNRQLPSTADVPQTATFFRRTLLPHLLPPEGRQSWEFFDLEYEGIAGRRPASQRECPVASICRRQRLRRPACRGMRIGSDRVRQCREHALCPVHNTGRRRCAKSFWRKRLHATPATRAQCPHAPTVSVWHTLLCKTAMTAVVARWRALRYVKKRHCRADDTPIGAMVQSPTAGRPLRHEAVTPE
jgi:hypothetical protein